MKIKYWAVIVAIVVLLGAMPMVVHGESEPYSLLLIGDSNIEYGPIANGYAEILDTTFGDGGSGYVPLNATFTNLAATGIQITSDAGWLGGDMNINGRHAVGSIYTPNGLWTECSTPGAKLTITFEGNGIDLYYTALPGGGVFRVTLDGEDKGETATDAEKAATQKLSFTGLTASGTHTLQITLVSGRVVLTGVDRLEGSGKRAVVHNWGNNSADTIDFTNVDENVMVTAVQELKPDAIVVLLGTNDVLSLDEKEFAANLTEVVKRLQKATDVPVMIISHFKIFREYSVTKDYLSYSWPTVSEQTGCTYWNMYNWYGDGVATLKESSDGVHCNAAGGKRIAAELYTQVENMRNPKPSTTTSTTTTTQKSDPTTTKKADSTTTTTKKADVTTTAQVSETTVSTDESAAQTTVADAPESEAEVTTTTSATEATSAPEESDEPTDNDPKEPDGGFPVWAIVLIIVVVIAAGVGGCILWKKKNA